MKNKTSFVIAHRITSIQNCDRIIVLDKGKVIEQGTQKDLLSIDGFFKKIYNLQVLIEEEIENEIKQG